jgi:hypothetical protein
MVADSFGNGLPKVLIVQKPAGKQKPCLHGREKFCNHASGNSPFRVTVFGVNGFFVVLNRGWWLARFSWCAVGVFGPLTAEETGAGGQPSGTRGGDSAWFFMNGGLREKAQNNREMEYF